MRMPPEVGSGSRIPDSTTFLSNQIDFSLYIQSFLQGFFIGIKSDQIFLKTFSEAFAEVHVGSPALRGQDVFTIIFAGPVKHGPLDACQFFDLRRGILFRPCRASMPVVATGHTGAARPFRSRALAALRPSRVRSRHPGIVDLLVAHNFSPPRRSSRMMRTAR